MQRHLHRIELVQLLEEIIVSKTLRRLDALKLRGRMQFAAAQLFGRLGKRCLALIIQHAYSSESFSLAETVLISLKRFKDMMEAGEPRVVSSRATRCWYLFTDACHEQEAERPFAGIGAVLVNDYGQKVKFMSEELPSNLLHLVNVTNRKTIIFECEFFALLCAITIWKDILAHCNIVVHTDNDAVRDSFIAGHTTSENGLPILDACLRMEYSLQSNVWITRVPTESNISDEPSRLQCEHLLKAGCSQDRADVWQIWMMHVQRQSGH